MLRLPLFLFAVYCSLTPFAFFLLAIHERFRRVEIFHLVTWCPYSHGNLLIFIPQPVCSVLLSHILLSVRDLASTAFKLVTGARPPGKIPISVYLYPMSGGIMITEFGAVEESNNQTLTDLRGGHHAR